DAVAAARVDGRSVLDYAGGGLRDTTRIAGSLAELWRDIALANAGPLRAALAEFRAALDRLDALIAAGDAAGLGDALDAARTARRRIDEDAGGGAGGVGRPRGERGGEGERG